MATDVVIIDGDKVSISVSPAVVPAAAMPVSLTGSGFTTVNDRPVCIVGDELPPSISEEIPYTAGSFSTPGTGTFTLTLNENNKTSIVTDNDNKMLLKGASFTATFDVSSPAIQPGSPPVNDPTTSYPGTAQFISTNTLVEAE